MLAVSSAWLIVKKTVQLKQHFKLTSPAEVVKYIHNLTFVLSLMDCLVIFMMFLVFPVKGPTNGGLNHQRFQEINSNRWYVHKDLRTHLLLLLWWWCEGVFSGLVALEPRAVFGDLRRHVEGIFNWNEKKTNRSMSLAVTWINYAGFPLTSSWPMGGICRCLSLPSACIFLFPCCCFYLFFWSFVP